MTWPRSGHQRTRGAFIRRLEESFVTRMATDGEYVLGTSEAEIQRLALQHRVWRPHATAAWEHAGFTLGQTIVDAGCGPGWATLDLAEVVGTAGRVIAIDQSAEFLSVLRDQMVKRQLRNIETIHGTLGERSSTMPSRAVNGVWCRWVLSFVPRARTAVAELAQLIERGGALVLHEYFNYGSWRLAPRCHEFEEYVRTVMESWRDAGGEPDIALELPGWLAAEGLRIESARPLLWATTATHFAWQWPVGFFRTSLTRLVSSGHLTSDRGREIAEAVEHALNRPGAVMFTPAVLELIARRPGARPSTAHITEMT